MEADSNERKTVLSAGRIIKHILRGLPGVPVYPVIAPAEGLMPAIVYRRASLAESGVKCGLPADAALYEMEIWAAAYAEGLAIAERVRSLIGQAQGTVEPETGLRLRSASLENAYEQGTVEGAYIQCMTFLLRINGN